MKYNKKIIYVSRLCSGKVMDEIFSTSVSKPGLSAQKFHQLIAEGFAKNSDSCSIETLSTLPVTPKSNKRKIWRIESERIDGVKYNYVPILNLPIVKNIFVFIAAFFKSLFMVIKNGRKKTVFICDVLNISVTSAALLASKLTRVKAVAVVTDLPNLMIGGLEHGSFKRRFYNKMASILISNYDGYILLTEQMNGRVNKKNKPYMIMEGLVDINMTTSENMLEKKAKERIICYAGGIYEKYGVKKVIDAFMQLEDEDLRLHIYGPGAMADDMPGYMQQDGRIVYFGMVPNKEVVAKQLISTLLVNPRSSREELAKYSFPSKNMEYMVSGTPIVTTPLPGMPQEYYDYVYIFDDESVDGFYKTFKELLKQSREQLYEFGMRSKEFVLDQKNNILQSKRILDLLEKI